MTKFDDIYQAFLFVSSGAYGMHSAVVRKDTGETLYQSEMADMDEIGEKELDPDQWLEIPHRNDLDLGRELVFEFVKEYLPDEYNAVQQLFKGRGAYGRIKEFLDSKGLLDRWNKYSDQREEAALRQWCKERGIDLSDDRKRKKTAGRSVLQPTRGMYYSTGSFKHRRQIFLHYFSVIIARFINPAFAFVKGDLRDLTHTCNYFWKMGLIKIAAVFYMEDARLTYESSLRVSVYSRGLLIERVAT